MNKCDSCNKSITKRSPGLECSRCTKKVHASVDCAKVSAKQLTALRSSNSLEWSCNECCRNTPKRGSFYVPEEEENEEHAPNLPETAAFDVKKLLRDISSEIRKAIKEEVGPIQSSLDFLSDRFDDFQERIETMESKLRNLEGKNSNILNSNKNIELRMAVLEEKQQEFEQNLLCNQIEIAGIPKLPNLTPDAMVKQIAKYSKIEPTDMQLIREVPPRGERNGSLIVELKSKNMKESWIKAARNTPLSVGEVLEDTPKELAGTPIYIREALTQYNKTLLWKTKQQLRNSFKFICTSNGRILIKKNENAKVMQIRTEVDILSMADK
ncbi:hypothetical protein JYU34_020231 [Plutella xylostella]|uniref:Uncharacterized protein n=1 Tax=Plutella xylostella TaxID=51655 RepID=A0ABQ7PXY0_PLUXY|nr:hypothetical protein JYU34_020231 [Plutella xylostella]